MAVVLEKTEAPQAWGTFEGLRDHLYAQFLETPWVAESGLTPEELEREARAFLAANPAMPRVLQKAHLFRLAVTRAQIALDPLDWYADKLNHGGLVRKVRDEWLHEAKSGPLQTEASWFDRLYDEGVVHSGLDMGHISPGWENMFQGGLTGLLERAEAERARLGDAITPEQRNFYDALEIVYGAAIRLAERYADLAETMLDEHPEHAPHLTVIAEVCRRVPAHSPRTFHEALQFEWLMHELIEMEGEYVRSMGHFDRTVYPYYQADIAAGRLTRDQARELIEFFWYKYYARTRGSHNGKNFLFGGQDALGNPVCNDLTFCALDAYDDLRTPDPKLSVRFVPGTPDALYRRVAELIRTGHNSFVLMNDVPAVEALVKMGKALEDARTYLPIGCYEPAVDGKEVGCTMNITLNLAKAVEYALFSGVDALSGQQNGLRTGDPRAFATFDDFYRAYRAQLEFLVSRSVEYVGAHERLWPQINPSPLIAGTIDDCIDRGKDVGQGGAHYNSIGCVGVGLANVCDSLLAVKQAVFDEKRFCMDELLEALRSDFEGREPMRQYLLNRVPKWGNNDPAVDTLGREVADHYCSFVHTHRNARGGRVQAALFALDYQWRMGRFTGALPDGRKARESLAPGTGSSYGRDKKGVTGLVGSVTKLDFTNTPNGAVVDVVLHPTAIRGDDGLDAFVSLIKTFFERGGYAIQFNVFDVKTLRNAQRHPERYASLQIRVTGWSVYFNALTKFEQDQFIARNAHLL